MRRRWKGTRITCVAASTFCADDMSSSCPRVRGSTGGASFGRATGRSRCGTCRPANAWRRWKGTGVMCWCPGCTFVMIWLLAVGQGVAVFPDGRSVPTGSDDAGAQGGTRPAECVATLEGHSSACALRRPSLYFQDDLLRRRSMACHVSGRAARRVWTSDNTLKVWDVGPANAWRRWKGTFMRALRRPLHFCDDLSSSEVWCRVSPDGRRVVSGSEDRTLKVWDVAVRACVATLEGHSKRALRRPLYFCDDLLVVGLGRRHLPTGGRRVWVDDNRRALGAAGSWSAAAAAVEAADIAGPITTATGRGGVAFSLCVAPRASRSSPKAPSRDGGVLTPPPLPLKRRVPREAASLPALRQPLGVRFGPSRSSWSAYR